MDIEYASNTLDTPSLITPSITINPLIYKPSYISNTIDVNNTDNNNSSSNPSSILTTTTAATDESLSVSSADIKLSKIENDLKQSFTLQRKPTESPFQKMAEAGVLKIEKNLPIITTTDDTIPADPPSTAEVMNDIESFSKYTNKDNVERETITAFTSDNNHFDSSPTHTMGVIVSPKKKLLIRSQSQTEPTSSSNNNFSQSQKPNIDDEDSMDDDHQSSINNRFQRIQDLPILAHTIDSNSRLDNIVEPPYTIHLRTDQNGVQPTIIKPQSIIVNNKRTFQQAIIGAPIPKSNPILITQQPFINEVTSSDPLLGMKRQKMTPMPTNNITLQSTFSPSSNNNNNNNIGSDDQRRKQIRDSNREAARRCRERRRHYIEQLEGNLEQCKNEINKLNEKLTRTERENTQLRAILTEAKIFHTQPRHSSNEAIVDFVNVISTANGIELNSETSNGNALQRNYITRNTH